MFSRCLSQILAVVLSFSLTVFAQTTTAPTSSPTESAADKEKAQKKLEERVLEILDQAVGDAGALRLPQNRAIVYALAGDMYWKFDEKRAREMFRNAGNEILLANAEIEKDKKADDDPFYVVFDLSDIRGEILPLVAKRDAEMALEMLAQTRTAKITEAMNKAALPNAKQEADYMNFNPEQNRARQEIALEQRFALLAAEQNPDKAIKLIKDSLAKGISWNVAPLLQRIYQKDEKKAAALADDIVKKITETDLAKKRDDLNAAIRFLQAETNPNQPKTAKTKQFKFSDAQAKEIANKIFDTLMQPSNSLEMSRAMTQAMASLEKYLPEKIALLKQKQSEAAKNLPPEVKSMQQREKLWIPNSTPEEILADVPKLNEDDKAMAYQSISDKIGQIDDDARAKKIIEQIPDEKARAQATEQYESARISRTAKDGKLDEAKKMIGNLSKKKTQINKLVALALEFHKKGGKENLETAAGLMKDAKSLTNEFPEDEDEVGDVMELVKGYATINADEAFRLFEPIVDQINETVQASAVLSKYNKRNQNFKKGELVMKVNGYSWDGLMLFRYISQIEMLGKADLNRMSLFSDKFARSDTRTIVKLFVAQGFLKEDKKENATENTGGGGMIIIGD